jgi:ribonuclease T2
MDRAITNRRQDREHRKNSGTGNQQKQKIAEVDHLKSYREFRAACGKMIVLMRRLLFIALCALLVAGALARTKRKPGEKVAPGDFDYYLLALSWAPDFCARPDVQKDPRECGAGRKVGFIVHGLWPQQEDGGHPSQCAPARPVAADIVQKALSLIPSEGLIQHEWRDHGTCSGLDAATYFNTIQKAKTSIVIPPEFVQPSQRIQASPKEIEAKFIGANPKYRNSFRIACSGGQVSEVRICMGKDLSPHTCSTYDRECPAPSVTMLPVR